MKNNFTLFFLLFAVNFFSCQTWEIQNQVFPGNYDDVADLSIVSDNNVWIYTNNNPGKFAKTINGNASWVHGQFSDITSYYTNYASNNFYTIIHLSGIDALNASVMVYYSLPVNNYAYADVWKTNDGGTTWQKKLTIDGNLGGKMVHFFNANTGFAISTNATGWQPERRYKLYRTNDGGQNWTLATDVPNTPGALVINKYTQGDAAYIWESTVSGYRILKTTDQGLTWSYIPHYFGGSQWNLTAWSDINKGIVVEQNPSTGVAKKFLRTTDGGLNWTEITSTGIPLSWIGDIAYVPGTNVLLATGQGGSITSTHGSWISTDNGNTFTTLDSNIYHKNVRCSNGGICYSGGINMTTTKSIMYKLDLSNFLKTQESKTENEGVYPNPTKGEIYIKSKKEIITASIYDLTGRLLIQSKEKNIDTSPLASGIYFLKIKFQDGTYSSEKIIRD
ncbi:WD40/YVTN/BNR-like repeat-containing protein [Chryseobacterium caseinilyticum]|uniref:T9SS type A sorting domain-containing protein n=1 Tax=Chryseobacterium caseinilyticum TaxID=2771428 RepID=A0ABR8ZGS2_9FLAO|nr:T9SS type A sorting domain-containing protein [Chryseobacterium caseinilyticum]MBD8084499.1 T9SS type A sorting domain-containing protein [Chryseobacterium caseinilyticum]